MVLASISAQCPRFLPGFLQPHAPWCTCMPACPPPTFLFHQLHCPYQSSSMPNVLTFHLLPGPIHVLTASLSLYTCPLPNLSLPCTGSLSMLLLHILYLPLTPTPTTLVGDSYNSQLHVLHFSSSISNLSLFLRPL